MPEMSDYELEQRDLAESKAQDAALDAAADEAERLIELYASPPLAPWRRPAETGSAEASKLVLPDDSERLDVIAHFDRITSIWRAYLREEFARFEQSLLHTLEIYMSKTTDALDRLSTIETQLESDEALEASQLAALQSEVATLNAQLATATTEDDSAQVDAITARIQAADARIQDLLAANQATGANPTPTPTPAPTLIPNVPVVSSDASPADLGAPSTANPSNPVAPDLPTVPSGAVAGPGALPDVNLPQDTAASSPMMSSAQGVPGVTSTPTTNSIPEVGAPGVPSGLGGLPGSLQNALDPSAPIGAPIEPNQVPATDGSTANHDEDGA